jgi:hypothetical protein
MIVALGFCQKDAAAARDMLSWCEQLGGCRDFDALLVTDPSTQWSECVSTMDQAAKVFRTVSFAAAEKSVPTWPQGANELFKAAAAWSRKVRQPFLWLEADAIPLRPGWLKAIHFAYNGCGQLFMGRVYRSRKADLPERVLSGIAVYPPETEHLFKSVWRDDVPWDVATASVGVRYAADTDLIQWFWGKLNRAPTFVLNKGTQISEYTYTLDQLQPNAVLFHRNKDGTLLDCLRSASGIKSPENFVVVFPFRNEDSANALEQMNWTAELGGAKSHDALLWYESRTDAETVSQIATVASRSFARVLRGSYRDPKHGANGAWITAAGQMQAMRRPWLWMEPDAIPLRQDWLRILQVRYNQCGKPFMGPIVPHMEHMNGTAIYPTNALQLCRKTIDQILRAKHAVAWDYLMKFEVRHLCHDCSDIYQHAWAESNGQFIPFGGDICPSFPTKESLSRLNPTAVIFHRCKDQTLINRLRETVPK